MSGSPARARWRLTEVRLLIRVPPGDLASAARWLEMMFPIPEFMIGKSGRLRLRGFERSLWLTGRADYDNETNVVTVHCVGSDMDGCARAAEEPEGRPR